VEPTAFGAVGEQHWFPTLRKVREGWGTRHYNLRMNFTWPDPISLIADIVTFCCVPTLTIATIALWKAGSIKGDVKKKHFS
jgi:hypothetical protein